jgi:hypothetical protein
MLGFFTSGLYLRKVLVVSVMVESVFFILIFLVHPLGTGQH